MSITTFISDANKDELLKDEWITIADITTTEEVLRVDVAQDISGNPFSCKELYVFGAFPNRILESRISLGFSVGNIKDKPWYLYQNDSFFLMEFAIKGRGTIASVSTSGWNFTSNRMGYVDINTPFDRVKLWTSDGFAVPVGTRITIWGLKA